MKYQRIITILFIYPHHQMAMKNISYAESKIIPIVRSIFIIIIWVLVSQTIYSNETKNLVIPLSNSKYLLVQPCSNQIFRIRISDKAYFPETLMERYGIVKTDWDPIQFTTRKEKENQIIKTSGFQFIVSETTGSFSVIDSNG